MYLGVGMSLLMFTTLLLLGGNMETKIHEINSSLSSAEIAEITQSIYRISLAYNLEPRLVAAVIATESRFKPKALGKTHGEIGLMQLRPNFHATFIPNIMTRKKYLFVIDHNLVYGIKYLSALRTLFCEQYGKYKWLEFYNRGPSAHPRTFTYTKKVLHFYRMFGGTVSEQRIPTKTNSGSKRRQDTTREPAKSRQTYI